MKTRSRFRRNRAARAPARPALPLPSARDWGTLVGTLAALALIYAVRLEEVPSTRLGLVGWGEWLARVISLSLLLTGTVAYLWVRKPDLLRRPLERWFLIGLVLSNAVLFQLLTPLSPYLIPMTLSVGLAVMFFDVEFGLVINLVLAGLVGLSVPETSLALVLLPGGLVMALRARRLERSRELVLIGLEVGLIHILALVAKALFEGWDRWQWAWQPFAAVGLNGPISALLIMGLVPLVEYLLQRTSPLGLIELLNTAHPLLERLTERAPGTYQHSLSVAQLASEAARVIGADALLTRVGALYHDIGKAAEGVSPEYFAENQRDGHNPHDHQTPDMSKLILVNHVKAGLEMGQAYGLKQDVLQFIAEHHGTTVMRFFYLKALQDPQRAADLSLSEFRYEGPKPRTKETAILMLADAVESASRTVEGPDQLEAVIDRIIKDRLEDGQFDECPLTMADLRAIKEAFVQTLRSMMHSRPRHYPDAQALKRAPAASDRAKAPSSPSAN